MPFEPFTDFTANAETMARFHELDRRENLSARFAYFLGQDPGKAMHHFGLVKRIISDGFATKAVAPDMAFSVGWYYTWGVPELMLVGANLPAMEQLLTAIGARLDASASVIALLEAALPLAGLAANTVDYASDAFLDDHPYGYGWYFYAHFLDNHLAPILACRVHDL